MTFDEWFNELVIEAAARGYAQEAIDSFNKQSWYEYYADGDTPKQALDDDERHA